MSQSLLICVTAHEYIPVWVALAHAWLTDHTDISYEIAEMIIAHQVGSQVERAYNRTDYLDSDVTTWSYGVYS